MSRENVETVGRFYDCLNRGDVDGVLVLCGEDFRMDMSGRIFNPDTYVGHDGIRRFCREVTDAWQSYRWDVEETRVVNDAVVALLHCRGTSREGGPEVDWRVAWLWRFQGSGPISLRFYRDRDEALEAVGLSE